MASRNLGGLSVRLCSSIVSLEAAHARWRRLDLPAGDTNLSLKPPSDDISALVDDRLVPSARRLSEGIEQFARALNELLELLPYLSDVSSSDVASGQIHRILQAALRTAGSQSELAMSTATKADRFAVRHERDVDLWRPLTGVVAVCQDIDSAWVRTSAGLKAAAPDLAAEHVDIRHAMDLLADLRQVVQSDARLARSAFQWLLRTDPMALSHSAAAPSVPG